MPSKPLRSTSRTLLDDGESPMANIIPDWIGRLGRHHNQQKIDCDMSTIKTPAYIHILTISDCYQTLNYDHHMAAFGSSITKIGPWFSLAFPYHIRELVDALTLVC
jgi:hypothetical protein